MQQAKLSSSLDISNDSVKGLSNFALIRSSKPVIFSFQHSEVLIEYPICF